LQEHKIKISLEQSHNAIKSRCESIILKCWFVPLRVKLNATDFLDQTTRKD